MEIKKIYKTFESQKGVYKVAISNLSFVLPNKGLISIVGRSGSGKTTLLNIIGGLEKPTSGDIVINTPMSSWSEDDFARYRKDNVSFIFQEFNLLDHMSIKENFELAFAIVGEKYNKDIIEKFGGEVPNNLEDLRSLAGVGRKTAKVVFSVAFNGNAIAVDTHVFRVSNRIGLVNADNVFKTEKGLMEILDESDWSRAHHYLIYLGRSFCKASKPDCASCPISAECLKKLKR